MNVVPSRSSPMRNRNGACGAERRRPTRCRELVPAKRMASKAMARTRNLDVTAAISRTSGRFGIACPPRPRRGVRPTSPTIPSGGGTRSDGEVRALRRVANHLLQRRGQERRSTFQRCPRDGEQNPREWQMISTPHLPSCRFVANVVRTMSIFGPVTSARSDRSHC